MRIHKRMVTYTYTYICNIVCLHHLNHSTQRDDIEMVGVSVHWRPGPRVCTLCCVLIGAACSLAPCVYILSRSCAHVCVLLG